ncbi:MAG: hypothetical protein K8U57_37835 [Planctomycetes bacterium]|nr:hypothetical protein [Planctomycetota bacterium]
MNGQTLPEIARSIPNASLDVLRTLVRKDVSLRKLGTRFGAVRVFNEAEAEQIVTAYRSRQERRMVAAS